MNNEDETIEIKAGDLVKWNDPDGGICSKLGIVLQITIKGEIVHIVWADGSDLDCLTTELQRIS